MSGARPILGDCLSVLPGLEGGSVDLVLADPPYGVTACKWDSVIPLEPLWAELKRVLKPRGAVVLTASQPFTTTLIASNRGWFRYTLVWAKSNGTDFLNVKHRPFRAHEDVVVFSPAASTRSPKGSMTYNPQMGRGSPRYEKARVRDSWRNYEFHSPITQKPAINNHGSRYPTSVIRIPSVNEAQTERAGHGTQKPLALMEYLIRTYSNEGDAALDFCMGSGTTAVACLNTGRKFVGIEKDEGFFKVAQRRLAAAQPPLPLEAPC